MGFIAESLRKAVLLIALSLKDRFRLPIEQGSLWYGLSADTIERGLAELQRAALMVTETAAWHSKSRSSGWASARAGSLSPFGPRGRAG